MQRREVRVALELHRTVADLLRSDRCEEILEVGRRNIARMRETPRATIAERWLDEWAHLLGGPIDSLIQRMLAINERGIDLRQISPFAGALTQDERLDAIRRARRTPE
ncbi:UNVERIFIED_ORG: putative heme iron utilization protein [Arthrobacter sp. UYEF2]